MNYTPIAFPDKITNAKEPINVQDEVVKLKNILASASLPDELRTKASEQIGRIEMVLKYGGNVSQLDIVSKYIDWISALPWDKTSEDKLDIGAASDMMNKSHHGLASTKKRVLEYLSVLIMQRKQNPKGKLKSPTLFFVGLAGTGKTTFARSIAESLGRSFARIPFGGLSCALDLRGQSKVIPEADPGLLIKALRRTGYSNSVILLDELDRVSEDVRGAVMGVLLETLDPEQNSAFIDHYIDFPFDLSRVIFVAAANNTKNVATAVLDRLEVIQMPSYTDEEKVVIARDYILPNLLESSGLSKESLMVSEEVWKHIARLSGYDPGIRSVERKVQAIVRKIAYNIVAGKGNHFEINQTNMKDYVEP